MKNLATHQLIFLATAALLLVAILPLPYDFYLPMRTLVAISGGYLVYIAYQNRSLWLIPIGIVAFVLFAPVFGFEFEKQVWVVLDLVFVAGFVYASRATEVELAEED